VDAPDRKRRSIDTQIDDNLRKIFEEDVEQDLPDRLQRLLDELDGVASNSDDEDSGNDTESGGGGAGGSQEGGASGEEGSGSGEWANARQVAMTRVHAALNAQQGLFVARARPG
jgi:hypothetical protein